MTEKQTAFKTTKEYLERRLNTSICVCVCVRVSMFVKNRQERQSLHSFVHTFSHVCMHTQTHAPGVPAATITVQEEKDHSRDGKWKHVLKKKGFNFHESSVKRVYSVSLFLSSCFFFYDSLSTTLPVSVCVIDFSSLFSSLSWQQHIRYDVWMCVSVQISLFLRSLSFYHLLLSVWSCQSWASPHYRKGVFTSVVALHVCLSSSAFRPLAFLSQSLLVWQCRNLFRWCSY